MRTFRHHVLGADDQRLAKTTAEEGVELMAYSTWLSASLEYWVNARLTGPTRSPALQHVIRGQLSAYRLQAA